MVTQGTKEEVDREANAGQYDKKTVLVTDAWSGDSVGKNIWRLFNTLAMVLWPILVCPTSVDFKISYKFSVLRLDPS